MAGYANVNGAPTEIVELIPGEGRGEPLITPGDITDDGLFLGPVKLPGDRFVASLTLPVYNNTTVMLATDKTKLGFMTVVFNINALREVTNDTNGLGRGKVLVVGPGNRLNRWEAQEAGGFRIDREEAGIKYLLPPKGEEGLALSTVRGGEWGSVLDLWHYRGNKTGVEMDARDPSGVKVAIGYGP